MTVKGARPLNRLRAWRWWGLRAWRWPHSSCRKVEKQYASAYMFLTYPASLADWWRW